MIRELSKVPRASYPQIYTNPSSQGTLMCETPGFPSFFDDEKEKCWDAYSDRVPYEIWRDANKKYRKPFRMFTDQDLKGFCKLIFAQEKEPTHARIVYFFNVSTGYDCPRVDAIFEKNPAQS